MLCLTCKTYCGSDEVYCRSCGNKTVDYRCACGNEFINYTQKFCQKCGKPVPPKLQAVEGAA